MQNRRMNRIVLSSVFLCGLGLSASCNDGSETNVLSGGNGAQEAGEEGKAETVTGVSEGDAPENSDDEEGTDEEDDSPETKYDVDGGGSDGNPDGGENGCKKVDFLFVIDNSGSMGPFERSLIAIDAQHHAPLRVLCEPTTRPARAAKDVHDAHAAPSLFYLVSDLVCTPVAHTPCHRLSERKHHSETTHTRAAPVLDKRDHSTLRTFGCKVEAVCDGLHCLR